MSVRGEGSEVRTISCLQIPKHSHKPHAKIRATLHLPLRKPNPLGLRGWAEPGRRGPGCDEAAVGNSWTASDPGRQKESASELGNSWRRREGSEASLLRETGRVALDLGDSQLPFLGGVSSQSEA